MLFNARPQDPPQKVGYVDDHWLVLRDGLAAAQESTENLYVALPLRNVAAGLAVLHGWHLWPQRAGIEDQPPAPEDFRRLPRDLYVPAGDISFWQAALRDRDDPLYEPVREAIAARTPMSIDILYGDHEGGQRTITRFYITPRTHRRRGALAVDLLDLAPLEPRSRGPALAPHPRRTCAWETAPRGEGIATAGPNPVQTVPAARERVEVDLQALRPPRSVTRTSQRSGRRDRGPARDSREDTAGPPARRVRPARRRAPTGLPAAASSRCRGRADRPSASRHAGSRTAGRR